jgi:hypothetical protein
LAYGSSIRPEGGSSLVPLDLYVHFTFNSLYIIINYFKYWRITSKNPKKENNLIYIFDTNFLKYSGFMYIFYLCLKYTVLEYLETHYLNKRIESIKYLTNNKLDTSDYCFIKKIDNITGGAFSIINVIREEVGLRVLGIHTFIRYIRYGGILFSPLVFLFFIRGV